jgi:hypothetical protein
VRSGYFCGCWLLLAACTEVPDLPASAPTAAAMCAGLSVQEVTCDSSCTTNDQCDPGLVCMDRMDGPMRCLPPGS